MVTGTSAGTTYYLNDPVGGAMEEWFIASGTTTWRDYIMADGKMVALRSSESLFAISVPSAYLSIYPGYIRHNPGYTPA